VQTLDQQAARAWEQYGSRRDDLARNTFLTSLKEQNQVLYFRVSSKGSGRPGFSPGGAGAMGVESMGVGEIRNVC
jgi:hypothetical protein